MSEITEKNQSAKQGEILVRVNTTLNNNDKEILPLEPMFVSAESWNEFKKLEQVKKAATAAYNSKLKSLGLPSAKEIGSIHNLSWVIVEIAIRDGNNKRIGTLRYHESKTEPKPASVRYTRTIK